MVLVCTALAALVGCTKGNLSNDVESGTYLGVIGFHKNLYQYRDGNLQFLNPATRYEIEEFIDHGVIIKNQDGSPANDGTALSHAVYTAIDNLEKSPLPADIENVSIVTFTDGLDAGSYRLNEKFSSDDDYLAAVEKRLSKDKIGPLHITAYSIGKKGFDVMDTDKFKSDLRKLATSDDNWFMVEDMSVVNETFRKIASSLFEQNTYQSIELSSINAPGPGQTVRFTFDIDVNVIDSLAIREEYEQIKTIVNQSELYIEAVYTEKGKKNTPYLTNITYHGFKGSETEIEGSGIEGTTNVRFTIGGISPMEDGRMLEVAKTLYFKKMGDLWQKDAEFKPSSDTNVESIQKSAAVILVIDYSSSLQDEGIANIMAAAKGFIRTLSGAGSEPVR